MPLTFNIRHAEKKDLQLEGELPAAELELDGLDPLVHTASPLAYNLTIQKLPESILAQGSIEITLECECSRCLKLFKQNVLLENWTLNMLMEGEEKISINNDLADLTPYIREDILLEFPQHPLCQPDCAKLPDRAKKSAKKAAKPAPADKSAWAELNKLKFN